MIQSLKEVKPNVRITIVPVVNVWGRKRVDNGDRCLRKNKNGVDTATIFASIKNIKAKITRLLTHDC